MTNHLDQGAAATGDAGWRIDELAQRTGVTVDTIRYYQREGLLPAGERVGRTLRYGSEHVERLERIRCLQARRFSLAAIRALLEHEGPVADLFGAPAGATYDRAALVEAAGTTGALVDALERARFLPSPGETGRAGYDGDDLEMLRALRDLGELGVPEDVLVAVAVVVAERTEQLHHAIVGILSGTDGPAWDSDAKARFEHAGVEQSPRVLSDVRQVMSYADRRSGRRLALEELRRLAAAAPDDVKR